MINIKKSLFKILFLTLTLSISILMIGRQTSSANSSKHVSTYKQSKIVIPNVSEKDYENNIHGVIHITPTQIMKKVSRKSRFILFVGYKECKYCRAFSIDLKKFISLKKDKVYYLDLDNIRQKKSGYNYNKKFEKFIQKDLKLMGTPTIALINKGNVNQHLNYSGYGFKLRDLSKFIPKHKRNLYVKKIEQRIFALSKKINNESKHSKKNAKKIRVLKDKRASLKKEKNIYL